MRYTFKILIFGIIGFAHGIPLKSEEEVIKPFRQGIVIKKAEQIPKFFEKSEEFKIIRKDDSLVSVRPVEEERDSIKDGVLKTSEPIPEYEDVQDEIIEERFVDDVKTQGDLQTVEEGILFKSKPIPEFKEAEERFTDVITKESFADKIAQVEFEEQVPQQKSEQFVDPIETVQVGVDSFQDEEFDQKIKPLEFVDETMYYEEPEQKFQYDKFYPKYNSEIPEKFFWFFGPVFGEEEISSRFIPSFQLPKPDFKPLSGFPVNSFFVDKLQSLQDSVKSLISTLERGLKKQQVIPEEEVIEEVRKDPVAVQSPDVGGKH